MLGLLREVGFPSMMLGAFRHALKGITDDEARKLCARVAVGMLTVYAGGDVRESLNPALLSDDSVVSRMVEQLRLVPLPAELTPEQLPELEPGELEPDYEAVEA